MDDNLVETQLDGASGHHRPEPDTSGHTLTIDGASELFAEAGVPRNPRSIRRFCQNKELDCISIETPTSRRYLINRQSAEKLIVEKQQAMQFAADHRAPDMTAHDRSEPDASGHNRIRPDIHAAERQAAEEEAAAIIKRLEDENVNLRIDNRAKEQVITMLRDERHEIQNQFQEVSYRLGAAEARVAQLEAPKRNPQETIVAEFDTGETASSTVPPPIGAEMLPEDSWREAA